MYSIIESKGTSIESVQLFLFEPNAHEAFDRAVKENEATEANSWIEAKRLCKFPDVQLDGLMRYAYNGEWAVFLFPDRSGT